MRTDLDYLAKQLQFAASARTQVGLRDALSRANDALERLREQATECEKAVASMHAQMDDLLAFAGELENA